MVAKPTRGTRPRHCRNLSKCNSTDWRNIMPLKKGTSQAVVSSNIKTLVHEWEEEGSIGSSHPATKQKAVKQAVAISMEKAGISRNTQPRGSKKGTSPLFIDIQKSELTISSVCISQALESLRFVRPAGRPS